MDNPSSKQFLLFITPIVGVIIGVALLLSPATSGFFGNVFSSSPEEGGFTYYSKTISGDELAKLEQEKQVFTVYYSQPVDGAIGSVWDTKEEADQAEAKYREEYGDTHDLTGPALPAPANEPASGELTTITQ